MNAQIFPEQYFQPDQIKLMGVFFPSAMERVFKALNEGQQFVHYCDAAAAASMIRNREVWMRNATWMNDSSEITYGIDRLFEAGKGPHGVRLRNMLEAKFPGFTKHFDGVFISWLEIFRQETYITCFTELLEDEELIGRLSMWRAYGAGRGVAFVVNGGPMLRPSDALKANSSPVAYLDAAKFNLEFKRIVDNIERELDYLVPLGKDLIFNNLFSAFRWAIMCTKHPGFKEEREWRAVYQPLYMKSDRLIEDTQTIGGLPQRIFKIPLKDYPEEGFYGATVPDLVARIIIGPGPNSDSVRREFVRFLHEADVPDADSKVVISDVPLRT